MPIQQNSPPEAESFILANQVRNQSHEASALDSISQLALMPCTDARALAWNDLSKRGKVTAKRIGILIVDFCKILLAEITRTRCHLFLVVHRCRRIENGSTRDARDEINKV